MNARARNLDAALLVIVLAAVVASGIVAHLNLRSWTTLLGSLTLAGLLWRTISTWPRMSALAQALSVSLGINLGVGAVAQILLVTSVQPGGPPPPANTLGLVLIIVSRLVTLLIVVKWSHWLNHWHRSDG